MSSLPQNDLILQVELTLIHTHTQVTWLQRWVDAVLPGGAEPRSRWSCSLKESRFLSEMVRLVCRWNCCSLVHRQVTVSLHHRFHLQLEGLFFTVRLDSSPALTVLQLKVPLRWKPINIQTVPFSIFPQKGSSLWHDSQNNYDNSAWNVRLEKCLFFVLKICHQLLTDVWFSTHICTLKCMFSMMFDRKRKRYWITLSMPLDSWQASVSGVTWFRKALKNSANLCLLQPKRYFSKLKHRNEKKTSQVTVPAPGVLEVFKRELRNCFEHQFELIQ